MDTDLEYDLNSSMSVPPKDGQYRWLVAVLLAIALALGVFGVTRLMAAPTIDAVSANPAYVVFNTEDT